MALKNHDGCDYSAVQDKKLHESFQIIPNPATNHISLVLPDQDVYHVSIMDLQGRLIQYLPHQQNQTNIEVSNLQSGMYLIKILSNKGFAIEKMLKK